MTLAVTGVRGASLSLPPQGQTLGAMSGAGEVADAVLQAGAAVDQWRVCTVGVTMPQYGGVRDAGVAFFRGVQSSLPSDADEWVLYGDPGSVISLVPLLDVEQSVQLSAATPL